MATSPLDKGFPKQDCGCLVGVDYLFSMLHQLLAPLLPYMKVQMRRTTRVLHCACTLQNVLVPTNVTILQLFEYTQILQIFAQFYCLRQGTLKRGEGRPLLSCRGCKAA